MFPDDLPQSVVIAAIIFQGKVGALLIGVGVGVGVGLLIAPARGDETRADIAEKVADFGDKVRERTGKKPQSATGTDGD